MRSHSEKPGWDNNSLMEVSLDLSQVTGGQMAPAIITQRFIYRRRRDLSSLATITEFIYIYMRDSDRRVDVSISIAFRLLLTCVFIATP